MSLIAKSMPRENLTRQRARAMDPQLTNLLEVPVAVLEEDGLTIRWANDCCATWLPEIAAGTSLARLVPAFTSKRAERGLRERKSHYVSARAPDQRGRERDVDYRRRPITLNGEPFWIVEGIDRAKAEVKQRLLEGHAKTIETNNRLLARRERDLEEKSARMRRLLDHMQEGMFVVDREGFVGSERSHACGRWFGGGERPTASDYMGKFDHDAGAWFAVSFEAVIEGLLPLDFTIPQLPTKMERDGIHLALSYVPISEEGVLDHLLVVVSDVTLAVQSERAKRRERDVVELTRRLLRDRAGLEQFIDEIDGMLATLAAGTCELDRTLRILHTIKGNCALFHAEAIALLCHELESELLADEITPPPQRLASLKDEWDGLVSPIRRLLGVDERRVVELSDAELANFVGVMDRLGSSREVKAIALSWRNPPVRNMLSTLAEQAAGLATRLDKELDVVIRDNALRLPHKPWRSFWSAMTHVVRNAVDHGIESREARESASKPVRGLVEFETEVNGSSVIVRVRDDGAGIAWDRVAKRRQARLGNDADISQNALCGELLEAGFSTREVVSEVSGRGIGLSAAAAACRSLGGEVRIASSPGRGTTVEFCFRDSRLAELAEASRRLHSQTDSGLFVASDTRPVATVRP